MVGCSLLKDKKMTRMSIEDAAVQVKTTLSKLNGFEDLSPNNQELNETLGGFVEQIGKWQSYGYGEQLLAQPDLQEAKDKLPALCAKAEGLMEVHWSNHFAGYNIIDDQDLREFWYYHNYEDITQVEIELMLRHTPEAKGFSFIGSGPLPMTVLIAARLLPNAVFECVDWDPEACAVSQKIIDKMNLSDRVRVFNAAAKDYVPQTGLIPIVASLIEGKEDVYKTYERAGIVNFMVRDAEDVYRFVYKPADVPNNDQWSQVDKTELSPNRLNTTRLYRLKL